MLKLLLGIILFSFNVKAQILQSGDLSLTSISPYWSEAGTFNPIRNKTTMQSRTFTFKSSVVQNFGSPEYRCRPQY